MQDTAWKVAYTNMLFNGDNKHVDSRFSCGNAHTLGKPDIGEKTFRFYKQQYAKNKLKIISVCNRDFTPQIEKILSNENVAINSHLPPQKKLQPPKLAENRLFLIKAETSDGLIISKSINLKKEDYGYLGFIASILDNVLTQILIEDLGLVDRLTTSQRLAKEYGEFEVSIDLSVKGKRELQSTIDAVFGALNSLDLLFREEIFEDVKKISKTIFQLETKPNDAYGFAESMLFNFIDYGFTRITEGYTILSLDFDRQKIEEIWQKLRKSKSKFTFLGKLKSSRLRGLSSNLARICSRVRSLATWITNTPKKSF